MAMKMLTVDGIPLVAFQTRMECDQTTNPVYIQRYIGLAGIEIKKLPPASIKNTKEPGKIWLLSQNN